MWLGWCDGFTAGFILRAAKPYSTTAATTPPGNQSRPQDCSFLLRISGQARCRQLLSLASPGNSEHLSRNLHKNLIIGRNKLGPRRHISWFAHFPTTGHDLKAKYREHPHLRLNRVTPPACPCVWYSPGPVESCLPTVPCFFLPYFSRVSRTPFPYSAQFPYTWKPFDTNDNDRYSSVAQLPIFRKYERWPILSCKMRWVVVFLVSCFSRSAEAWFSSAPVAGLLRHEARTK